MWVQVGKAESAARKAERDTFGRAFASIGLTLPTQDQRDPSLGK